MKHTLPTLLPNGGEGWTSFSHVNVENGLLCLRAPLWPEGDAHHRVLITRDRFGALRMWCEDVPEARTNPHTPCVVVEVVVVPSISARDLDTLEWEIS